MSNTRWRSAPMPRGWAKLREKALRRDRYKCQAIRADTDQPCHEPATDVDHIVPAWQGGTDDLANLRSLCRWHHQQKTSSEAGRASQARPPRNRPAEKHPGLLD